jgi:hypothetical protein
MLTEDVFFAIGEVISISEELSETSEELPFQSQSTCESQNSTQFSKFRVIVAIAESTLTSHSAPPSSNTTSASTSTSNSTTDLSNTTTTPTPIKTLRYVMEGKDAKLLIFYEDESRDLSHFQISPLSYTSRFKSEDIISKCLHNAKWSMSPNLTKNNKLDVCWYPEGFSSTFHRRGVNNFMFVRELQSKMIINRTRVSGGGIIEMGEFRISMPIEEISYMTELNNSGTLNGHTPSYNSNGEKIKRSFLVNIDLRELDGKQASMSTSTSIPTSSSSMSSSVSTPGGSSNSNSNSGYNSGSSSGKNNGRKHSSDESYASSPYNRGNRGGNGNGTSPGIGRYPQPRNSYSSSSSSSVNTHFNSSYNSNGNTMDSSGKDSPFNGRYNKKRGSNNGGRGGFNGSGNGRGGYGRRGGRGRSSV